MKTKSPKHIEVLKIIPDKLLSVLDELLEHYKFVVLKKHGRAMTSMVSPLVTAELVLMGWRNTEEQRKTKKED